MAAIGRGRGRGRARLPKSEDIRPGGISAAELRSEEPKSADPTHELSDLVGNLKLEPSQQQIDSIKTTAEKIINTKSSLDKVVGVIYSRCLTDWRYGSCCAQICGTILHLHTEDTRLRDVLLRRIQADFKKRQELRESSPSHYLGSVAFLVGVLIHLRDDCGKPIAFLCTPALDALYQLLDNQATDEELEVATELLKSSGKLLHENGDRNRLNNLRLIVREKILDLKGSKETGLKMINILESFASEWT